MDVGACDNFAIRCGVSTCSSECIRYLIECGADIHADNDYPIKSAVYHSTLANFEILLQYGANINVNNGYLLKLCANGYLLNLGTHKIMKILLEVGVNVHSLSKEDLLKIIQTGSISIIKLLVEYGVDFSVVNDVKLDESNDTDILIDILVEIGVDLKQVARILYHKN